MMKALLLALTISMLVFTPNFAQSQQGVQERKPADISMMNLQEHMQSMSSHMQTLQGEKNPEKRRQLIQQHMEEMQKGMRMMNEMDMSMGNSSAPVLPMPKRMQTMEARMTMMQTMMAQMMEHQIQADNNRPDAMGMK